MRVGEAFWTGREDLLEMEIIKLLPADIRGSMTAIATSKVVSGRFREGVAYKAGRVAHWVDTMGPWCETWRYALEEKIAADECAIRATEAVERLGMVVKKFRENTRNDTSSMKAASDRVQSEVSQMTARYEQALRLLNSPEFAQAIVNAERMATALEKISGLSETRLSVAVFSGGRPSE